MGEDKVMYYRKKSIYETALLQLLNPKNAEYKIQKEIVEILRLNKILVFAIPNGTFIKNPITRAIMQLIGLLSGVSDLEILLPNRCVFIEVKALKRTQTDNQKEFEENVKALGFEYYLWNKIEDAENFVKNLKRRYN